MCRRSLAESGIHCFHWELAFPQVFLEQPGAEAGFDVVIGNPPYDVLSEKESGPHVAPLKKFISQDASLAPSRLGKNNLYKVFICRALGLLREGGSLSFIVPMPLLGDEQASGVRKVLLKQGTFQQIHAFPQKDNPARLVFYDAKLATALFVYQKGEIDGPHSAFVSAVHPAQSITSDSPSLRLDASSVALYDPSNMTIVSCAQEDWDLAVAITRGSGIGRLSRYCVSFQGEVNETTHKDFLSEDGGEGRTLVLRGSNVCLYVLREASQGEPLYVDAAAFRQGRSLDTKAFHGTIPRIGFQRSSPQNNFRRLIAARIPEGMLCFDTVSYIPLRNSALLSGDFLLALLNSKLIEWYFRLGSTNSKVNEYQFNNLPCPVFADRTQSDEAVSARVCELLDHDIMAIPDFLAPHLAGGPFSAAVRETLEHLAGRVCAAEEERGTITRQDRARLSKGAQPFQDVIDLILFRMVGLSDRDVAGIEDRLSRML